MRSILLSIILIVLAATVCTGVHARAGAAEHRVDFSNVSTKPNLPQAEKIEPFKTSYDENIAAQLNLTAKQLKAIQALLVKAKKEPDDLAKKQNDARAEYIRATTVAAYDASVKKVLAVADECKEYKPAEKFDVELKKILTAEQFTKYKDLSPKK